MTAFPLRQEIYYPESDGEPMAETTGATFRMEGSQIRVFDSTTGRPWTRYEERGAEIDSLRAEIDRLKKAG
jgi:hypothetical protein